MRKSEVTEEQIIGFLKQAETGMAVAENCRKKRPLGIPPSTSGARSTARMEVSEAISCSALA